MKKIFSSKIWKYLIAFLVPTFLVVYLCAPIDNDTWYITAEGREIVEHGIFYTDQLTFHEGLQSTTQNYGFAVIFYLIYSALGTPGLFLMTLILNFLFMFVFYKLCMLLSDKNVKLSLILTSIVDSILAFGFILDRPQMVDFVVLTSTFYCLELFIKSKNSKPLWWIPVFSLLLINVHATTWGMLFAIILPYLIDGVKNPKLYLEGYKLKPLIIITIISLILGLVNPYGIKMITLIFTSYGNSSISNLVQEMHPFTPFSGTDPVFFLSIMATVTLYIYSKKKMKIRHLLLFFGFLALALNTHKALSELTISMFFPLAYLYKNWHLPPAFDVPKIGKAFTVWSGIMIVCLSIATFSFTLPTIKKYPSESLKEALDTIDVAVGETDKSTLKLYVNYDNGGYAEFRGYKPYLDPRAELFIEKNNKKADILKEWSELERGNIQIEEFLEKYEFDFLVTREKEKLHNLNNNAYKLIYDNNADDDEDNLGIKVYQKVKELKTHKKTK